MSALIEIEGDVYLTSEIVCIEVTECDLQIHLRHEPRDDPFAYEFDSEKEAGEALVEAVRKWKEAIT